MKSPLLLAWLILTFLAPPIRAQSPDVRSTSIRLDQHTLGIRQTPRLDPDKNLDLPKISLIPATPGKEVRSNATSHSMAHDVLIGAGIGGVLGGTGGGILYANTKQPSEFDLGPGFHVVLGAVGGAILGALMGAYVHSQR